MNYYLEEIVEGRYRGLVCCTIPAFSWRNGGKSRTFSVTIVGVLAEISNQDHPNKMQER
jgi:hypothetical protein